MGEIRISKPATRTGPVRRQQLPGKSLEGQINSVLGQIKRATTRAQRAAFSQRLARLRRVQANLRKRGQ